MTPELKAIFQRGPRLLHDNFQIDPSEFYLWNLSYSMFGEDLILRGLLKADLRSGRPGFYLDIGACDPRYGSNSYLFYRYGWRGICVEANAQLGPLFHKWRPRDVFVGAVVGKAGKGYFATGEVYAASSRVGLTRDEFGPGFQAAVEVDFTPLKTILDQHVPKDAQIDFMSMDIEDSELSALQSNDWSLYRPKIILIETHNINAENIHESAALNFLKEQGYIIEGIVSGNALLLLK